MAVRGTVQGKRWMLGLALAAASTMAYPAASSAAPAYEPEPPSFCRETVIRDYLARLERMPKLHSPPANGRIGFGSAGVVLTPYPSLVVGEGTVGYTLKPRSDGSAAHPRWEVTTTLSRINGRGRAVETLNRSTRRVTNIRPWKDAGVELDVEGKRALYRMTIVFHNLAGRELGGYGFYFRVVAPTENARLGLSASSYRHGQTVFGRVENLGTMLTVYGGPYSIERLEGSAWTRAPESPRGPWLAIAYFSPPGKAGPCSSFNIAPSMPPGRYRMVKRVEFQMPNFPIRGSERILYVEFDVVP